MNVLLGYGYHPGATGAYLQRALERRATTTYVGTPWAARPGFSATASLQPLVDALPEPPDLFFYVDSGAPRYFPRGLTELPCPTACYLIDVHVRPRELARQALFFDYAFSAQRDFVAVLRAAGHPQAHWLPLACDPQIHRRYDVPKRFDIGFVGTTGRGYARRKALLERLARRFVLNDYRRAYSPAEMAEVYSASRLVFNCALRNEVNMRVFEGPATGSLLLTDRIGNGLIELVRDGEHVVLYDDDELEEVAARYLGDEGARERIAQQGYAHVRAAHTYDRRIETVLQTVFGGAGPRQEAPHRRHSAADVHLAYADLYARVGRVDDVIDELKRGPATWPYRLPAAVHLVLCLARRLKLIKPYG